MKKLIVYILLLLVSLQPCLAEDWVKVAYNAWIDADSIEKLDITEKLYGRNLMFQNKK